VPLQKQEVQMALLQNDELRAHVTQGIRLSSEMKEAG